MDQGQCGRAVVLGGGVAGLLAARVLGDTFAEVVVVERDALDGAGPRRGVPQARHLHGLLARGQQALEELFPGLTAELAAAGAPVGDMLADTTLWLSGSRFRRGRSGLTLVSASRWLIEARVRARVRRLPNVVVTDSCDVLGLAATPDRSRVTGVRLIRRADGSAEERLDADVVVDATGRGSRAPVWLESLGYLRPPQTRVPIGVTYVSRTYRESPGLLSTGAVALVGPTPSLRRGGAVAALERDTVMVTLLGVLGEQPPTDPEGFAGYAATLPLRLIGEVTSRADALDHPVAHRHPASIRRHYEALPAVPDGLLVLGDAICTLNPIYGQGMTVAALEALLLRDHLRRWPGTCPRRWFRDVGRVVDVAWAVSSGADLAYPEVEGERTARARLLNAYVRQVHAGAARDVALGRAFLRVSGMVDPPQALLRPATVARVIRAGLAA